MATISKRGNTYRIKVSMGYDASGKQIEPSMTWKPDPGMTARQIEKELNRQATLFEERVKSGFAISGKLKFSEYADKWMQVNKAQLAITTYMRYESLLPRINAAIGHIRLDRLSPMHLQEFYQNLAEEGVRNTSRAVSTKLGEHLANRGSIKALSEKTGIAPNTLRMAKDGKRIMKSKAEQIAGALDIPFKELFTVCDDKTTLGDQTIRHHHRLIAAILSQATREQLIPRNIASRDYLKAPRVKRKQPHYLDDVQSQQLVDLLMREEDIRIKTAMLILVFGGMRRGELCGLEWQDVDAENQLLHIRQASQRIKELGVYTKEPKNESSIRSIRMPAEIFPMIAEYRKWWLQQKLLLGDRWQGTERLFISNEGGPMNPDNINTWVKRFRQKHNLPQFTPHSLRHTNVTLQIEAGIPIRTVAARAGHSQTSTTLNLYSHVIQSADEKAAQALGSILIPGKSKAKPANPSGK